MSGKNYTSKTCVNCAVDKPVAEFARHKGRKDGLDNRCKPCVKASNTKYYKTKDGVCTVIYGGQRAGSVKRGHPMPNYTKAEFKLWLFGQDEFHRLYDLWAEAGHKKMLKPSCDRLDDYKPYSFDNLQVITWAENDKKGRADRINGVNNKHSKAVLQLTQAEETVKKFCSTMQASRETGIASQSISNCCRGDRNTAGGFKWAFA